MNWIIQHLTVLLLAALDLNCFAIIVMLIQAQKKVRH
jgi:hypothetical protein